MHTRQQSITKFVKIPVIGQQYLQTTESGTNVKQQYTTAASTTTASRFFNRTDAIRLESSSVIGRSGGPDPGGGYSGKQAGSAAWRGAICFHQCQLPGTGRMLCACGRGSSKIPETSELVKLTCSIRPPWHCALMTRPH